jgi:uncharacterized protein (TIGR03086 family)
MSAPTDHADGDQVLSRFEAAVDVFDERVHLVHDERWAAPTPCADWDVRALVNHVVGEQAWVVPLMAGRTVADVGAELDGDLLGSDPCAAWHHYCGPAHAAFAAPDALAGTVHLSYGDEQAAAYCDQLTFDALVHAWDLARGAGLDDRLPDDLVHWGVAWATPLLPMLTGSGMFGQPVAVAADGDPQTRLLAMVGRRR